MSDMIERCVDAIGKKSRGLSDHEMARDISAGARATWGRDAKAVLDEIGGADAIERLTKELAEQQRRATFWEGQAVHAENREREALAAIPNAPDIARFLRCWDVLGHFEASHQLLRKWGAFDSAEWPEKPDPAVVRVAEWLKTLATDTTSRTGHSTP
jgi:hypothetical protein